MFRYLCAVSLTPGLKPTIRMQLIATTEVVPFPKLKLFLLICCIHVVYVFGRAKQREQNYVADGVLIGE
jgi:hypothetical protein